MNPYFTNAATELSGHEFNVVELDIAQDYPGLLQLIQTARPDAIVHFSSLSLFTSFKL